MKLFGLMENLIVDPLFIISIPHYDLFEKLEKYKSDNNLSIGIQTNSSKKTLHIPPLDFHTPEIFLELYKYFKNQKRKIYFLETRDFFKKSAEIARQGINVQKKIKKSFNDKERQELRLEDYRLSVEFNYQMAIGINEIILTEIAKHKPDLVFVGEAHANWFYLHKDKLKEKYQIEIEEYWRDRNTKPITNEDIFSAMSASRESLTTQDILRNEIKVITEKVDECDANITLENLLIQRKYDAIKKERITYENPHFIGTWNLNIVPRGLFELFVHSAKKENGVLHISGTIEDCLGTATFDGTLSQNSINFTKIYDSEKSMGIKNNSIDYSGFLTNKEFTGSYIERSNSGDLTGRFKMKQLREIE